MSDVLKQIYNACDPYKPASAEYYLDCGEARGGSVLTQEFQRHLSLADDYLCFLFSGHIGCGKSSELSELKRTLENPQPDVLNKRYFTVLLDVSEYLDDFDVASTDILLAIITELAATLRDELQIELKDPYITKRLNEMKSLFLTDVEINKGDIPLLGAKVEIQRLKKDPEARQKVRAALLPHMSSMLEEINLVFEEARLAIKQKKVGAKEQPYTDIVLILDNLEKIRKLTGIEEGTASQRELFLERYTQFTGMQAHIIYTVPLRLVRSPDGPQLEQRYGPMLVLPMVKIIERTHAPYPKGVEFLHKMLQKRFGNHKLDDILTPGARDFLVTYSGGHIRNLMTFVQNACTYTNSLPIPIEAVQKAVQQSIRTFSGSIPETHWAKLASLDASSDQQIINGDADYLVMLENLSVLEYINGGDENDPFTPAEPWYAVNPIVRQLQKFKAAVSALPKGTSA